MIYNEFLKILCCPSCKSDLVLQNESLVCINCAKSYNLINGIPILLTDKSKNAHYEKQKEYFDNEFRLYDNYVLAEWQKKYIYRISKIFGFDKSNIKKNEIFIDIGAGGSGYTVIEFAKLGYPSVGCDLSMEGVIKAKQFSKSQNVQDCTFWVVCSAEELPFKSNTFKFLCCNAVLEHLPDEKQAINEFGRICQYTAKGYVTVPLKFRYLWPFFIPLNYYHDKRIGHLRRYDEKSLGQLFEQKGFKVKDVFYTGHLLKVIGVILSILFRTNRFDNIIEMVDGKLQSFKYGASNIGVSLIR